MKRKFLMNLCGRIIGLTALGSILIVPFLPNFISPLLATIIFGCALVVFPHLYFKSYSDEKQKDISIITMIYFIFISIFINKYYYKSYDISWMIFVGFIILMPCGYNVIYFDYKSTHNVTPSQINQLKKGFIINSTLYYLLDFFYMSFIIKSLIFKYIFGGLTILYLFYVSTKSFIQNNRPKILFILQDVLIALGITIYLIFIINDENLRNIITSIVSSLFGGYVTLLGVAWTIRDNTQNRKDDEKRNKVPYLYVDFGETHINFDSFSPILEGSLKKDKEKKLHVSIEDFIVKNSNNSDCVPCGFYLNSKFHKFDNNFFVERGKYMKIKMPCNYTLNSNINVVSLSLVVKDVLDNYYKYDCELEMIDYNNMKLDNQFTLPQKYKVINLGLPKEIDKPL